MDVNCGEESLYFQQNVKQILRFNKMVICLTFAVLNDAVKYVFRINKK